MFVEISFYPSVVCFLSNSLIFKFEQTFLTILHVEEDTVRNDYLTVLLIRLSIQPKLYATSSHVNIIFKAITAINIGIDVFVAKCLMALYLIHYL